MMASNFFKNLREDIDSVLARDPAARSRIEVILCYPGFHALVYYRIAGFLWRKRWYLLARFISHIGKILTTVEIHPGATIGRRFFVDHGTGVVIGETAEIGDDVTLYQGVTLGGTSLEKGKRHPTLEDGVIVGSGAQILGPVTVGQGARVGANAVVVKDVPAGATMVGIPARMVMKRKSEKDEFRAYGVPTEDLPDPVARAFETMRNQIQALQLRIDQLEGRAPENHGTGQDNEDTDEPAAQPAATQGGGR
jgi:serine O-acetyltransferase